MGERDGGDRNVVYVVIDIWSLLSKEKSTQSDRPIYPDFLVSLVSGLFFLSLFVRQIFFERFLELDSAYLNVQHILPVDFRSFRQRLVPRI